jgi:hypothetical protein
VRRALPIVVALVAVAAVIVPYVALGGATYEPAEVADPCVTREWRDPGSLEEVLEQVVLSALDGAACELGVSREDLVLAVRSEDALEDFADEHGLTRDDAEQAVEDGLLRAVDDAEEAGALPDSIAGLARRLVGSVPPWLLLETLDRLSGFLPGG